MSDSHLDALRINRFLADCGLGSRRACEQLVEDGRVSIDGSICRSLGERVLPEAEVRVDRKIVRRRAKTYLMFHKPSGVICSRSDERGRPTIYDRISPEFADADYVGRLDRESEGLLLLTNDGDLALKLTHPRHKVSKEYEVSVHRTFQEQDIAELLKGTFIEERRAKADSARILSPKRIKIILSQGIKRQIRIMLSRLEYDVDRLVRTRFGPLFLGKLPVGEVRKLGPDEIAKLQAAVVNPTATARPSKRPERARPPRAVSKTRPAPRAADDGKPIRKRPSSIQGRKAPRSNTRRPTRKRY